MSPRKSDELRELTKVFADAGAPEPEQWARSQLEEGIPQLAIFSFAKACWEGIVDEGDTSWIDSHIEFAAGKPKAIGAQVGHALKDLLAKGVSRETISDLVRFMQYEAVQHVCCVLDGSYEPNAPISTWALAPLDDDGEVGEAIEGVHEVLLSLDPTGRELRPRGTA